MLPDFTMLALSSALEVLRVANRVLEREGYTWQLVSEDGDVVTASNGVTLSAATSLDALRSPSLLVVCGGLNARRQVSRAIMAALRRTAAEGVALAGLCSGGYALARAGLLDGYTAVVHRSDVPEPSDEFPAITLSDAPYVIDRDRFTAGAGTAPMELMLDLVEREHGRGVALAVMEQLGHTPRGAASASGQAGVSEEHHQHLMAAAELMEAHVAEPLSVDALADRVGVSRRQMERLFRQHLGTVPSRYYMSVRLRRAQALLATTTVPIMAVATACGFETAAHFSRCYRAEFGYPPSEEPRGLSATAGVA